MLNRGFCARKTEKVTKGAEKRPAARFTSYLSLRVAICIVMQVAILFIFLLQLWICVVSALKSGKNRDQCPDIFDQPFDYESIAEYSVIGHPAARIAPCVAITQLSVGRLDQLEALVTVWKGVISAAIYVPTDNREANLALIQKFSGKLMNRNDTKSYTILSVLFGHEDTPSRYNCTVKETIGFPLYPVNNLRNLAVAASAGPTGHKYPLFFLTDADFYPAVGLRSWIDAHAETGLIKRCEGGDMIVIPAFESEKEITSSSQTFLLAGIRDGTIKQFHIDRYIEGHRPTDYAK